MKLEIEALVVDSFAAAEGMEVRGTAVGNAALDVVTVRIACYTLRGSTTCVESGSPCVVC